MSTHEEAYRDLLKRHSYSLVAQDGKILTDVLFNVHDSAVSLALLPFCALYCRSAKEFFELEDDEDNTAKEVMDIRNGLKIFVGKHSKGIAMAFESDMQQDEVFRKQLRFSFLEKLNIHLNLGVYFNRQGKVVFDTQLANFYLNIPDKKGRSDNGHSFSIGKNLGKEIASILINYCGVTNLTENTTLFCDVPEYGYIDFNTNKRNRFFNNEYDKEANLVLLHMLSTIGFVNNILVPLFKNKNEWLLRVVYIAVHNTLLGMSRMEQHIEQNRQNDITDFSTKSFAGDRANLLSTSFRNCMMHYGFIDRYNQSALRIECYDPKKQFYGLIESCFDGLSFAQYFMNLYTFSQVIEEYLLSFFCVNPNDINWDWD